MKSDIDVAVCTHLPAQAAASKWPIGTQAALTVAPHRWPYPAQNGSSGVSADVISQPWKVLACLTWRVHAGEGPCRPAVALGQSHKATAGLDPRHAFGGWQRLLTR